jgi:hypothetical protein
MAEWQSGAGSLRLLFGRAIVEVDEWTVDKACAALRG